VWPEGYYYFQCHAFPERWLLQVDLQVFHSPILHNKREDQEERDRQQVVVKHRVPVFKSHLLDFLPHSQQLRDLSVSMVDKHNEWHT
jgi:hypothetical protein